MSEEGLKKIGICICKNCGQMITIFVKLKGAYLGDEGRLQHISNGYL